MIVLGRFTAPFGVRGWLRVHSFGDDPLSWGGIPQWWLSKKSDALEREWVVYSPEEIKVHSGGLIAKLLGVNDRSAAEALEGSYIGVMHDMLPPAKANEYYWDDLIGLRVLNLQGKVLGFVTSLLETGAHDVMVVARDQGFGKTQSVPVALMNGAEAAALPDRLLPFVAHVIQSVDLPGKTVHVDWDADW